MLEHTKKRRTEKVEARFIGSSSAIARLRRDAKAYGVLEITQDTDTEEKEYYTIEEVFPEMEWNAGGASLRGARAKEGMTQLQLSELTGPPRRHISEMEHGKRPIGKEMAKKFAKVFNCDYRLFL